MKISEDNYTGSLFEQKNGKYTRLVRLEKM